MGLDITFYEKVEPVEFPKDSNGNPDWDAACDGNIISTWNADCFPGRAAPLTSTGAKGGGRVAKFHSSYGGYGKLRCQISQHLFGKSSQYVWDNLGEFTGRDGLELVNFSDCEGFLGPDACARISKALRELDETKFGTDPDSFTRSQFVSLRDGFALAANGGCAEYH